MISATLITKNEEESVGNALKSLEGLADEIIVVDSGSSDKTLKIAKEYGAKTFTHQFETFDSQKNWAMSKANGDWILSIDADERITEGLKMEIKEAVKDKQFAGFLIPRRNFILGKEIKHSRWSPDAHIWLWKKDKGMWKGDVHEEVIVNGRVGRLKNSKIHNSHKSIFKFMEANNKYSELEAQKLSKIGIKFSFWKMIYNASFEFIIRYFYKRGFLDGFHGFALSYLMMIYKFEVMIKLWEKEGR